MLGTLFVILSLGVFFGSLYLTDVLETIGKRDYLGQTKRFDEYREFFARLTSKGFEVDESKPTIVQGRTTYSWSIRPRGSTDTRSFEWDHDLQANVITPRTNGAVLMDLQNKYISVQDAEGFEFYNPDDKLALAIVHGDSSELSQILSDGGWGDADSAASLQPPLPPLTDPKHPKRKNGGLALPGEEDPEAAEEAAAAAAAGNIADGTGSGEATDVGEGEEAPPGDDGSVEVGGGEEAPGDGEETEPGDDEGTDVGTGEDTGGESSPEDGGGGEEEPGNGDDSTPVGQASQSP
ncbi:hypothetical protein IT575_04300 [bacterium]|nr:hypothetical protein [bacterium]